MVDELIKFGTLLAAVIGIVWAVYKSLSARDNQIDGRISEQITVRTTTFDNFRSTYDSKFAASSQRDAELSERITAMKLEAFRELGAYVTRAEFDKRMERMENGQFLQNAKLDTILERLTRKPQ